MVTSWKGIRVTEDGRVFEGVFTVARGDMRLVLDILPVMVVESFYRGDEYVDGAPFPTRFLANPGAELPPQAYVEYYGKAAFATYQERHKQA